MTPRHLNIVSFSVPYPANYGGVIDVYHKLEALHKLNIRIHLHCFRYDRQEARELNALCESVTYYPRYGGFSEQLSLVPYIVKTRRSELLLKNLLSNDYPILFEGLHSCYYLDHPGLSERKKIYRESNIEHQYYYHLAKAEHQLSRKLYFLLEAFKLRIYQRQLRYADLMLAVSQQDTDYLKQQFPEKEAIYLPSFHGNTSIESIPGQGEYALYHGNLSVPENLRAAEYLANEVFDGLKVPLIVAGLNPPETLVRLLEKKQIRLIANPSQEAMQKLVKEAQINILVTFQATGLKLKLLNTLFQGRHVLVNPAMLAGTGLQELCHQASTTTELQTAIRRLFTLPFNEEDISDRAAVLNRLYSDTANAAKLADLIFH